MPPEKLTTPSRYHCQTPRSKTLQLGQICQFSPSATRESSKPMVMSTLFPESHLKNADPPNTSEPIQSRDNTPFKTSHGGILRLVSACKLKKIVMSKTYGWLMNKICCSDIPTNERGKVDILPPWERGDKAHMYDLLKAYKLPRDTNRGGCPSQTRW